jgi:hypothetical protein
MKYITKINCDICNNEVFDDEPKDMCKECYHKAVGLKRYTVGFKLRKKIWYAMSFGFAGFCVGFIVGLYH